MKFFSFFILFLLMCCSSQTNSPKVNVEFEDIYHHYYNITPEKFEILDSQEKVQKVYLSIAQHYGGKRRPPIPQVTAAEKYIIFKPTLKNTNDVEITKVMLQNQTLYIDTKPFYNPDVEEKSRIAPNILIKIYTKQNLKKVIINTEN